MKVPANKTNAKTASKARSEEAEEVEQVEQIEAVEEVAAVETPEAPVSGPDYNATPQNTELVRFALTQDIEPAPRIGKFDMVHFTGQAILRKGLISVPHEVAIVLKDKGYGDIVG